MEFINERVFMVEKQPALLYNGERQSYVWTSKEERKRKKWVINDHIKYTWYLFRQSLGKHPVCHEAVM